MSAKIHPERMMHRNSIAVRGESAASYALLKLIPAAEAAPALPLNLALVLDVSASMYEEDGTGISRLKRVQQAALAALPKLRPIDTLAIVAFGHEAAVVLEPTSMLEREKIADLVKKIDRFEWHYIDVEKAEETERIFVEEFGHLTAAMFTDVKIRIKPVKDVKVKRCRQVAPEIKELQLEQV